MPKNIPLTLACGNYEIVRALLDGSVKPDGIDLTILIDMDSATRHWRFLREGHFDVAETSCSSYIVARDKGMAITAIPVFLHRRFRHGFVFINTAKGIKTPKDLIGKKIGIKSFLVTAIHWMRGILQHEYGVDPARVTWVCSDDGHLAEYRDPPNVERTKPGAKPFDQMLLEGEIDAAVIPDTPKDPRIRPLIPDPQAAARAWYEKYRVIPINHLLAVRQSLAQARPDAVREIYRVLLESKKTAPPPADGIDFFPFGIEANRKPLETIVQYAFEQKIIPRRFAVDEIFADTKRILDA